MLTRPLLNALLYRRSRAVVETPAAAAPTFADVRFDTEDGERFARVVGPSTARAISAWAIEDVGATRHRGTG